uniref:Carcinoembryonic antigen-related cell adhesion molecule 1 n=1 Tax=Jaculus jaculus TaxID=51337 RepID=A0A8C5P0S8_JACJA
SLLTFWNVAATAQLTVEAVPPNAVEGQDALLPAHSEGQKFYGYIWYKGSQVHESHLIIRHIIRSNITVTGPAYTGRETVYPNGSLLLQNLTLNDSGVYTLQKVDEVLQSQNVVVKLSVYQPVTQPSIQTINSTVAEDDSVTLTCLSEGHAAVSIRWLFNNEELRLTDRMKLTRNNSVLTIDPVWRADAGLYQCEVSNPVSSRKSGLFRLVVLFDPTRSPGLSGGAIAGIVVGSVAGVTLAAALAYFLYFRKTGGASDGHHLTEHKLSASNHSQGPFENHLSKVDEIAYSALNFNAQQPKSPAPASPTPAASETIYSEVKKK